MAEELVASIIQLYGEGLERIFAALDEPGPAAASAPARRRRRRREPAADPRPLPGRPRERVLEALDSVRPYMESHGGDVELVGIEDGVARMRLVGHCEGCPASEATLELAIKKALEETAPDLEGLEVEGVASQHAGRSSCRWSSRTARGAPAWTDSTAPAGGRADGADDGRRRRLLVANVGGTLLAYRNACAWCRRAARRAR